MNILRNNSSGSRSTTASQSLWNRTRLFDFDIVSMSVFRVALALYILFYAQTGLLESYQDFYTDKGVLPRWLLFRDWPTPGNFSLLALSDYPLLHFLFWKAYLFAALAMAIGYRTQTAVLVLLIGSIAVYWRNPMVLSHVPLLLNLLLIWACFLPLDRYWSVDAALSDAPRDRPWPKIPLAAVKLQISSIYLFSALFKLSGQAWTNGSAVIHALSDSTYGHKPVDMWLIAHAPAFLVFATYAVLLFQLGFSFLIYSPVKNDITRAIALTGAFFMHMGFLVFLKIGAFPQICFCYLCLLVPDEWWRLLFRQRQEKLRLVQIYYDPDCGFCRKTALLLREFCLPLSTPVLPADQATAALLLLKQHNSWVVYDACGQPRLKWDAVGYVMRQSPVLFPVGWLTGLSRLRPAMQKLYDWIGAHRRTLASASENWLQPRPMAPPNTGMQAFCALLALLALASNILLTPAPASSKPDQSLAGWQQSKPAKLLLELAAFFQVRQSWDIFAPDPHFQQFRLALNAKRADGTQRDWTSDFPKHIYRLDADGLPHMAAKWPRYFLRIGENRYSTERAVFALWLCRQIKKEEPDAALTTSIELKIFEFPGDTEQIDMRTAVPALDQIYACPAL